MMAKLHSLIAMPLGIGIIVALFALAITSPSAPGQDQETTKSNFQYISAVDDDEQPPRRLIPPVKTPPTAPDEQPKVKDEVKKSISVPVEAPITSKLAFQALTISNKIPGIEVIPDKITIPSTKRFQIVTALADGKVKWMVFNKGKEPVEWLQLPGTKSIQVFPNYGVDDEITVYAYTAVDGDPTDQVRSVIIVGKDAGGQIPNGDAGSPGDPQTPDNPQAPISKLLHLTIITDAQLAKTNPPLATLIASSDLRAGTENRGHKLWIMDQRTDADRIKERGFDTILRKVGKVPLYIIQDTSGAVIDSGLLPTTLVSILQKLDDIVPAPARLSSP